MVMTLAPHVDHFVMTATPTAPASRAWNLDEVLTFCAANGVAAEAVEDFDEALAQVLQRGRTVLVTGSFHTVGDAMARLQVSPLAG